MAQIVGGFVVPHAPMYMMCHDTVDSDQKRSCDAAFQSTMKRAQALEADTVILMGDDHYTLFNPGCIPPFLIGIGDVDGPIEPWLGVKRQPIDTNEPLANHILSHGFDHGVDWAVAKSLTVDHSIFVPWYYSVKPIAGLRTIPVYINSGIAPLVRNRRCFEVGQQIRAAVETWDTDERVIIFASGGGAHWPGLGDWDRLNPEWDEKLLQMLERGDAPGLIALSDADIFAVGGNGGWELKNWICMMGAMGDCVGETIAYEPIHELLGAFPYLEMRRAA